MQTIAAQAGFPHVLHFIHRVFCDRLNGLCYSTVTDLARLRGLSTSVPRSTATW